ncbi:hypothetical protein A7X67_16890 [Clostridium sp. W14A]|nr:hypothetical protein A7X67_16890 [Clostridium sp. W14A]
MKPFPYFITQSGGRNAAALRRCCGKDTTGYAVEFRINSGVFPVCDSFHHLKNPHVCICRPVPRDFGFLFGKITVEHGSGLGMAAFNVRFDLDAKTESSKFIVSEEISKHIIVLLIQK